MKHFDRDETDGSSRNYDPYCYALVGQVFPYDNLPQLEPLHYESRTVAPTANPSTSADQVKNGLEMR